MILTETNVLVLLLEQVNVLVHGEDQVQDQVKARSRTWTRS